MAGNVYSFFLFYLNSAEVVNYEVKFTGKTWYGALKNKNSLGYRQLADQIVDDVSIF